MVHRSFDALIRGLHDSPPHDHCFALFDMETISYVPGDKVPDAFTDFFINVYVPADKTCHISDQLRLVPLDGIFKVAGVDDPPLLT